MKLKKIISSLSIAVAAMSLAACSENDSSKNTDKKASASAPVITESSLIKDKLGYSLGYIVGQHIKTDFEKIDSESVAQGLKDALAGNKSVLSSNEMKSIIEKSKQQHLEEAHKKVKENLEFSGKFLSENGKKPDITTTDSGLQYRDITKKLTENDKKELLSYLKEQPKTIGTDTPDNDSTVTVSYVGSYPKKDGTYESFDATKNRSKPATFALSQVIPGWREGLKLMHPGETFEFFIPPKLGYAEDGAYNQETHSYVIPPNIALKFKVTLLKVEHKKEKGMEDSEKSEKNGKNEKNEKIIEDSKKPGQDNISKKDKADKDRDNLRKKNSLNEEMHENNKMQSNENTQTDTIK